MPRIPVESLVSPRQSEVQLQPGVFQQTAQATANLLSAVDGAGQMVKAQFDRAQDIHNQATISDKRLLVRNARGEFQNWITENNIPPAQWGEKWGDKLKEIEKNLALNDEPPAVQRAVGETFKNFAGTSVIEITGAALKQNRKAAMQNFQRDSDYYLDHQQYDFARESLEGVRGEMTEEEYQDFNRAIDTKEEKDTREQFLNADPEGYKKWVNETDDLSTSQKTIENDRADSELQRLESNEITVLERELKLGPDGSIQSEEDLTAALDKAQFLSDTTKKIIKQNYKKSQPLSSEEEYGLYSEMDELQKFGEIESGNDKYRKAYNKVQEKINSYGNRPNSGKFRADIMNLRPSIMRSRSEKERGAYRKEASSMAVDLAKALATGDTAVKAVSDDVRVMSFTEFNQSKNKEKRGKFSIKEYEDYARFNKLKNAEAAEARMSRKVVIEEALFQSGMEYINGLKQGDPVNKNSIREYMEKNKDKTIVKALKSEGVAFDFGRGVTTKPDTGALLKAVETAHEDIGAQGVDGPLGEKGNTNAYKTRSDIPYAGVAANIRYNNPAAAYPRKADEKYGLIGYGVLNGGKQGQHKIGRFPTPTHGAAANLDLFASDYTGMTVYDAVRKWRGNSGRGEKTVVPRGYEPNMKITKTFLNNKKKAVDFFKKMALHESPDFKEMSDSDWEQAWQMWKNGGSN